MLSTLSSTLVKGAKTSCFLISLPQATFTFKAKTCRRPRGPWCAQNKFNIYRLIKWLCGPANENSQTFENCLATRPEHKKHSVTSFFRRISLFPLLTLPSSFPFSQHRAFLALPIYIVPFFFLPNIALIYLPMMSFPLLALCGLTDL